MDKWTHNSNVKLVKEAKWNMLVSSVILFVISDKFESVLDPSPSIRVILHQLWEHLSLIFVILTICVNHELIVFLKTCLNSPKVVPKSKLRYLDVETHARELVLLSKFWKLHVFIMPNCSEIVSINVLHNGCRSFEDGVINWISLSVNHSYI